MKKEEEPKVELELNNTEKLLQKGRILGFYFKENQGRDFPHFSMYDFKEKGAKEIIDFKILKKKKREDILIIIVSWNKEKKLIK